jgi:hypothetical protein
MNPTDYISWGSLVGTATGWMAEKMRLDSRRGQVLFLFIIASILALGLIQHPILWAVGSLAPVVERHGREVDHSPPSLTKVKNGGAIPLFPIRLHGVAFY